MKKIYENRLILQTMLAAGITIFIVAGIASATTIGTNISTDGALTVTGTTTIDSGTFYVDVTNNRVGIGTTTPQYALDVNGGIGLSGDLMIGGNTFIDTSVNLMNGNTVYGFDTGTMIGGGTRNAFFGAGAGNADTFGSNNVFLGPWAGYYNNTGSSNIFIGDSSGEYNTSGRYNVAIGTFANLYNSTGEGNVTIGYRAGGITSAHSKSGNVFLGNYVGYYETGSNKLYIDNSSTTAPLIYGEFDTDILGLNANVGIGTTTPLFDLDVNGDINFSGNLYQDGVLYSAGSGGSSVWSTSSDDIYYLTGNVGIGTATPQYALDVNGDVNIASGSAYRIEGENALRITVNTNNVFIGARSGSVATGSLNTFVGDRSGENITSGWYNTFIGAYAGRNNANGGSNLFVGEGSGYNSISGYYNTLLGNMSGGSMINGNGNVFIGNRSGYGESGSRKLYISSYDGMDYYELIYGDFSTGSLNLGGTSASSAPRLSIASNGNVGIGTTTPLYDLDVNGDINFSGELYQDGALYVAGGSSVWTTGSGNAYYLDGNVGIGTSTPSAMLTVGATTSNQLLVNSAGQITDGSWMGDVISVAFGGTGLLAVPDGHVLIGNSASALEATSSMYIDSSGNVGIGTAAPTKKLEVAGETRLSGDVTLENGATISNSASGTIALNQPLQILPITANGANAYLASLPGLGSYATGTLFMVTFADANTNTCTLNINSLGSKQLRTNDGVQITTAGRIVGGSVHLLFYDPSLAGGSGAFRFLTINDF